MSDITLDHTMVLWKEWERMHISSKAYGLPGHFDAPFHLRSSDSKPGDPHPPLPNSSLLILTRKL